MQSKLLKLWTPKQLEVYKRTLSSDWFMLINHGAKRSGKTVLDNDLFLQELLRVRRQADIERVDNPIYILGGVSTGTIYQNVLNELSNKYGLTFHFDKYGNFHLFGVYVVQVGTGTIAGLGKIRGLTAYGAYINEASLSNELVFDEIKARCSGYGARIICDTNPDHPQHWLKRDYIENGDPSIIDFKFTLYDNTFLNQRYMGNIIATTPSGMFTERNILGNWTIGEGAIYRDFDESKAYIRDIKPYPITEYLAGVDWGYSHYGAIVVLARTQDGAYILLEEQADQFKDIEYWTDVALDIKGRYGDIHFYCDSARPEHVDAFISAGLKAEFANKNILAGIEEVAKRFKEGSIKVLEDKVSRFKDEIYTYVWDSNGKPKKENDDVLDAIRYAIYTREEGSKAVVRTFKHSI